jgi:hypothetical protein
MAPSIGRARLGLLAVAAATLILAAWTSGAYAYVTASSSQRTSIDQSITQWRASHVGRCQGSDKLGFRGAWIATANPLYGQGLVDDNSCTFAFGYFVKRQTATANSWDVIGTFPDSAEQCSYFSGFLPRNVEGDFGVEGITGSGRLQRCAPKPGPGPVLPKDPCAIRHGSIANELLRSAECTKDDTVLEIKCGVEAAPVILPVLKYLKLIKAARDIEVVASLPERVRPAAEFFFRLYHAVVLKDAPEGLRTGPELFALFEKVHTEQQIIELLPKLFGALGVHQFVVAVEDLADVAGMRSCVNGLKAAASE